MRHPPPHWPLVPTILSTSFMHLAARLPAVSPTLARGCVLRGITLPVRIRPLLRSLFSVCVCIFRVCSVCNLEHVPRPVLCNRVVRPAGKGSVLRGVHAALGCGVFAGWLMAAGWQRSAQARRDSRCGGRCSRKHVSACYATTQRINERATAARLCPTLTDLRTHLRPTRRPCTARVARPGYQHSRSIIHDSWSPAAQSVPEWRRRCWPPLHCDGQRATLSMHCAIGWPLPCTAVALHPTLSAPRFRVFPACIHIKCRWMLAPLCTDLQLRHRLHPGGHRCRGIPGQ